MHILALSKNLLPLSSIVILMSFYTTIDQIFHEHKSEKGQKYLFNETYFDLSPNLSKKAGPKKTQQCMIDTQPLEVNFA